MNLPTWGRICSVVSRRLSLSCRLAKASARTPTKVAAHAPHANQVLDPTWVTPCQPLWIHPIESTLRLYHSDFGRTFRWTDSRGVGSISRPSAFATARDP